MSASQPSNVSVLDRWQAADAAICSTALALRAYSSRLIGRDSSLVLYGGGNTSLKQDGVLYVKGTGRNLANVTADDLTPLDWGRLQQLLDDHSRSESELMAAVDDCVIRPDTPRPSIETYMHAAIDRRYVEHAHADAVLALFNVADPVGLCRAVFGDAVRVVPYRHSGIALGRACRDVLRQNSAAGVTGLILAYHGVVAFGDSAESSYRNLLTIVNTAEQYLREHGAWHLPDTPPHLPETLDDAHDEYLGILQTEVSHVAEFPLAMKCVTSPLSLAFARHPELSSMATQGPPTPQHAIYTKRVPMIGGNVNEYSDNYVAYLRQHLGDTARGHIDPAPRVVVDPRFGFCAFGVNAHYADITAEIFVHDMAIMLRAQAHAGYRAAPAADIARAELEYGGFEQPFRKSQIAP